MSWEALAEEGNTTERECKCPLEPVCFQGKSRGMGMQHNHTATEEEKPRTALQDQLNLIQEQEG